jgi:hypothetical protein
MITRRIRNRSRADVAVAEVSKAWALSAVRRGVECEIDAGRAVAAPARGEAGIISCADLGNAL